MKPETLTRYLLRKVLSSIILFCVLILPALLAYLNGGNYVEFAKYWYGSMLLMFIMFMGLLA